MTTLSQQELAAATAKQNPKLAADGRTSSHDASQPCIDGHGVREIEEARHDG